VILAALYTYKMYVLDPRAAEREYEAERAAALEQQSRLQLRQIEGLVNLPGSYSPTDEGAWVFSDAMHPAIGNIWVLPDSALVRLVACLDRSEPATATVEESPVPLGVICYEALRYGVRPTGFEDGEDWPGFIAPTATSEGLAAARRAWQDVVAEGSYARVER
jgi:hypothetical protein